jgi:hypothetical protein
MHPWSSQLYGRFDEVVFESAVLKGNALGDPYLRPLWIYRVCPTFYISGNSASCGPFSRKSATSKERYLIA